jgi:hypothetical protein
MIKSYFCFVKFYFMKYKLSFLFALLLFSCAQETVKEPKVSLEDSSVHQKNKKLFSVLNPSESGVDFNNENQENDYVNYYQYDYYYHGGGVAIADFNNDGLSDLVFTANMSKNKIYLNKGNLKFEDISLMANLNSNELDWCTGVTVVDINNDGYNDIYISRAGWFKDKNKSKLRNLLFINNGDLTFTEKGLEYGLNSYSCTTQCSFFDADNDGDLDLYEINHPIKIQPIKENINGKLAIKEDKDERFNDKLFINENGKFVNKTQEANLENFGHGLGVVCADLNDDGWQDIYVSNDYSKPDLYYINQKNGQFKNEVNNSLKHMSKFSMGLDVADVNNDGLKDIFTTDMLDKDNYSKKVNMASMNPSLFWFTVNKGWGYQNMNNCLQLNNGNGTYSEIAWLSGVAESGWSWSPLFADFDNDGYKDLFISNGYKRDVLNKDYKAEAKKNLGQKGKKFSEFKGLIPSKLIPNKIFKNNGDLTFSDNTIEWGLSLPVNSNGSAYGDLDNDGDIDIVTNNLNAKASLYINSLNSEFNYVNFRLSKKNRVDIGATIEILDLEKYQKSEISNVHGYQSKSENQIHFGLGKNELLKKVLITWASGEQTLLEDLEVNKLHEIVFEDSKILENNIEPENEQIYFRNETNKFGIKFIHQEKEFDDYKREVLLPHKLSQEGPFIDVADVNGDDLEDFFVGNGTGYAGVLYVQNTSGTFNKSMNAVFKVDKNCEDIGVHFFDFDNDGDKDLYVVSGSNEVSLNSEYMLDRLYENDGKGNFTKTVNILPQIFASGSCVTSADFDNDGDLDLFVGGFQIPGKYPQAGKSSLLVFENGKFVDKTNDLSKDLQHIGMVKDAVFADLNNDNKLDLIVTGQWMPIVVYISNGSTFENKSLEYNTKSKVGWFNSLLVEDLNQDGFKDIVAGNLGLNTKHKASQNEPFKIFSDDFDGNGTNDIVLGYYNDGICYPVRGKQCSSEQIPSINQKIQSYDQFGMATVFQVYGKEKLESSVHFDATYFESTILYSVNGEKFNFIALSNECQFAPTNCVLSLDVNKDGQNEFVLAGNQYAVEVETGRYDAHTGNLLFNEDNSLKNLRNNGLNLDSDLRCVKKIIIKNKPYILLSSNRSSLEIIKY